MSVAAVCLVQAQIRVRAWVSLWPRLENGRRIANTGRCSGIMGGQSMHAAYHVFELLVVFLSELPSACGFGFSCKSPMGKDGACEVE